MADITKRLPDCDDERGRRGRRGHRGATGPTGPGGPATSLVGPTSGDGAILADEPLPPGSVIAAGGSAVLALANNTPSANPCPQTPCNCIINPWTKKWYCPSKVIGVASKFTAAGEVAEYIAAGPLVLDTSVWDARTGGSGGLVPNTVYYLSQTTPGNITSVEPTDGQVVRIGVALSANVLAVDFVQTGATVISDHITLLGNGSGEYPAVTPLSAKAYGFASFAEDPTDSWVYAPLETLPGTPIYKNLIDGPGNTPGQSSAIASAWLSSHVVGLSLGTVITPPPFSADNEALFVSGGLFELTLAEWNAVWTATDPDRGVGSGLLPGYPYYLSNVAGTFFLIGLTGTPPVGVGAWISRCFVALSPTVAMILLSDPRQNNP